MTKEYFANIIAYHISSRMELDKQRAAYDVMSAEYRKDLAEAHPYDTVAQLDLASRKRLMDKWHDNLNELADTLSEQSELIRGIVDAFKKRKQRQEDGLVP